MGQRPWQWSLAIVALCAVLVGLGSCARKAPGAGAGGAGGMGSGAGGSAAGGPGGAGGTIGVAAGPGGMGGAMGPGMAGATGTSIPALPSPREFFEVSALRDVHFEFDRYEVRTQDHPLLDANAKWLKSNPNAMVLIEGHADERGTNEYNLALGERRAKATRDYLVTHGVDGGRITMTTYGEERPLCSDHTEGCWGQNRRAHFLVKQ